MPALKYCQRSGQWKELVASLHEGDHHDTPDFRTAHSIRCAARLMGLNVSVRLIKRGAPEHRVTILKSRELAA